MKSSRLPFNILTGTVFLSIFQNVFFYSILPEKVAIHFGAGGAADSFSDKMDAAIIQIGLIVFMFLIFWGISVWMGKMPDSMFNLPNKHYWLGTERRTGTVKYMQSSLLWIGAITNVFLVCTFQMIINTNLDQTNSLGISFWAIFVVYIAATFIFVIKIMNKFKSIPKD